MNETQNTEQKTTNYFKISNGVELRKLIPQTDTLILSGDSLYGQSSEKVEPGTICLGGSKMAEIAPYAPIEPSMREDLANLTAKAPESYITARNWMVRDLVVRSEKPNWKKISECGKSDKLDLDFILPGLPRKSVGTLVSPGGTGKSMAIVQTAAHCVLGRKAYFNQSSKRRTVAYLSLEDPDEILHNRLHDLFHKLDPKSSESDRLDNHLLCTSINLSVATDKSATDSDAIIDLFEPHQKPDLIILDTARRAHTLDENSAGEMSVFIATLEEVARALDCAVLMLHHTSKGATFAKSKGEDPGAGASRGSSVLVDNARAVWAMHVMSAKAAKDHGIDDSERKQYIQLTHEKCNYQKAMDPVWLKRDNTGLFDAVNLQENQKEEELAAGEGAIFANAKHERGNAPWKK